MSNEVEGQKMADWDKLRPPVIDPVWDPLPWWFIPIIPPDKLGQIMVVQIDSKIQTMQNALNTMKQIREIVASECK